MKGGDVEGIGIIAHHRQADGLGALAHQSGLGTVNQHDPRRRVRLFDEGFDLFPGEFHYSLPNLALDIVAALLT